jgi:hypothetical protein
MAVAESFLAGSLTIRLQLRVQPRSGEVPVPFHGGE